MQLKKAKQLKFQIEQNMAQLQQLQQQPPPQQPPQGATPAAPPPPDPTTQLNQQIQQQVTELDDTIELVGSVDIGFIKLTPLVGG